MNLPTTVIENELKTFEDRFKEAAKSRAPLLDRIMRYVVKRKGKQLRPMFVLLSARLCGVTRPRRHKGGRTAAGREA